MSSSDRFLAQRPLLLIAALCLWPLTACTVAPLYGRSAPDLGTATPSRNELADIRGRVAVAPVNERTAQIFRDAILFRLNGGTVPAAPIYQLAFSANGTETVVSIQQGSGVPSASTYRMTVNYSLTRLSDGQPITSGTRYGSAPFDRSEQLYASSRALIDARDRAGKAAAEQVEFALAKAIRADLAK